MWVDRVDELEALQSIYGDSFSLVAAEYVPGIEECLLRGSPVDFEVLRQHDEPTSSDWSITCRICIHVALSKTNVDICIISEDDQVLTAGRVEHVPPVEILFRFATCPEMSVHACWLRPEERQILEDELHTLCMDMDGQPAMFACCEHVRSSLEDLERLVFPPNMAHDMLRVLLQYSQDTKENLFIQGIHSCVICYEDVPGSRCYKLECEHVYCCTCLEEKLRIDITEGTLDAIRCPNIDCKKNIEPHEIKNIVNDELFDRWESLTLKRALDTMADASYCPRCSSLALEDVGDNSADCPKCFFVFCTLCEEARHPGVECVGPETKLEILRQKAQGGGQAAIQELRKKEQEYKSVIEVKRTSQPCPSCGIAIQRTEGCNKMTCTSCGTYFCWKCNADISVSGYDHFKEGGTCILFDEQEILRWERQWEMQVGFQQAAMIRQDFIGEFQLGAGQQEEPEQRVQRHPNSTNCPNCGQLNYKIGRNNHIHCWSCTKYYCGLCRLVLQRRGGTHFSKDGCPQHS